MPSKPAFLFDNRLGDATPVASDTAAGDFDVQNLVDFRPFTWWRPATMPATVTVDSAAAAAVDYWLVWGHDLGTQGATIELRKSNDNFAANDVLVDSLAPADDAPFARYVTTADERYWRFRVTGATAPSLAIAAMGSLFEFPEWLEEGFDPIGREPQGTFNRSVKGLPLGRTTDYELWSQRLDFRRLDRTWIRNTFEPAWASHLRGNPFVFAWDRTGHPADLKLVVTKGGFATPYRSGPKADLQLELEAFHVQA